MTMDNSCKEAGSGKNCSKPESSITDKLLYGSPCTCCQPSDDIPSDDPISSNTNTRKYNSYSANQEIKLSYNNHIKNHNHENPNNPKSTHPNISNSQNNSKYSSNSPNNPNNSNSGSKKY